MKTLELAFLITVLFLSTQAHSAAFSLEGVVDGSSEYSITVNGVTMTVDSPQPTFLSNFPDSVDGLDFGKLGGVILLTSFNVSFDSTMSVTGWHNGSLVIAGPPMFTVFGPGVLSENNIGVGSGSLFVGGPLTFLANENYTFSIPEFSDIDIFILTQIDASVVPIPAAAWLFGSALFGLAAVKRKKA